MDVTITADDGSATVVDGFTYVYVAPAITGISQNTGTILGGDNIYVTGVGFQVGVMVTIDGVKAVSLDEIKQNQYDLIICSQVLEHIPYPHTILQDIVSAMSDATILYLEVPYEEVMREFSGSPDLSLMP